MHSGDESKMHTNAMSVAIVIALILQAMMTIYDLTNK